jgi:flagellin
MRVLNAMRYHQNEVTKSLERLSTGLRINRAADDPAGMAMAERMTSQINGARQTARNIAMCRDMAKSTDSVLANIQDAIQRLRELAVYAASDTISDEDRAYVQDEAAELTEYINDLIGGSQFNKIKLFAADTLDYFEKNAISLVAGNEAEVKALRSSVGKLVDQNLVMKDIYASVFSYLEKYAEEKNGDGDSTEGEIKFDKDKLSLKILKLDDLDLTTLEKAVSNMQRVSEALTKVNGYVAETEAMAEKPEEFDADLGHNLALNQAFQSVFDSFQGPVAQLTPGSLGEVSNDDQDDPGKGVAAWNEMTPEVRAFFWANAGNALMPGVRSVLGSMETDEKDDDREKDDQRDRARGINIFTSQPKAGSGGMPLLNLGRMGPDLLGLYEIDLSTRESSAESIATIEKALDALSSQRALVGAKINGAERTISSLETYASNLEEARSRIVNADIPAEMMNFTKHSLQYQVASQMLKATSDIETRPFRLLF